MTARKGRTAAVAAFLHRRMLALIVLSYAAAAVRPAPGLWLRELRVIDLATSQGRLAISLPAMLLASLLFTAGLRSRPGRIAEILRRPGALLAGLAANLAVPLAFLAAMVPLLGAWHNPDEAAVVLLGLALVTAMPIAGSSAGWSQAAGGDTALSLGLVLASTLLSPLTTPAALSALGRIAPGPQAQALHRLAGAGTGAFLAAWVLLPSALGLLARAAIGEDRAEAAGRRTAALAPVALVVLCYANASACLPGAIADPDWDFLAITLAFVTGLCGVTFAGGFLVGRALRVDRAQRASLVFGLGMNNNGTGLVLASMALGSQPLVLLPIIAYNLAQHLVAGCADAILRRSEG